MITSKKKEKELRADQANWAEWLISKKVGLDRLDDYCSDKEFRTARLNDLNFTTSGGSRGTGKVFPVSHKVKRKPKCSRGFVS